MEKKIAHAWKLNMDYDEDPGLFIGPLLHGELRKTIRKPGQRYIRTEGKYKGCLSIWTRSCLQRCVWGSVQRQRKCRTCSKPFWAGKGGKTSRKNCSYRCQTVYNMKNCVKKCREGDLLTVLSELRAGWVKKNKKWAKRYNKPELKAPSRKEVAQLLIEQDKKCASCGNEIIVTARNKKYIPKMISVDRIDNKKQYSMENIQITCLYCNRAQSCYEGPIWDWIMEALRGERDHFPFQEEEYHSGGKINQYCPWNVAAKDKIKGNDEFNKLLIDGEWFNKRFKKIGGDTGGKSEQSGLPFFIGKMERCPLNPSVDRIDNVFDKDEIIAGILFKKGDQKPHFKDNCRIIASFENIGRLNMTYEENEQFIREWFPNANKNFIVTYPNDYFEKCIHYRTKTPGRSQFVNIAARGPRSSKYHGVGLQSRVNLPRWQVNVCCNRKRTCIGTYDSEDDAARIYDAVTRQLEDNVERGKNFPNDSPQLQTTWNNHNDVKEALIRIKKPSPTIRKKVSQQEQKDFYMKNCQEFGLEKEVATEEAWVRVWNDKRALAKGGRRKWWKQKGKYKQMPDEIKRKKKNEFERKRRAGKKGKN